MSIICSVVVVISNIALLMVAAAEVGLGLFFVSILRRALPRSRLRKVFWWEIVFVIIAHLLAIVGVFFHPLFIVASCFMIVAAILSWKNLKYEYLIWAFRFIAVVVLPLVLHSL